MPNLIGLRLIRSHDCKICIPTVLVCVEATSVPVCSLYSSTHTTNEKKLKCFKQNSYYCKVLDLKYFCVIQSWLKIKCSFCHFCGFIYQNIMKNDPSITRSKN